MVSGRLSAMIGLAFAFSQMPALASDQQKAEILKQWKESAQLPRKKKKRRRKELTIDWSIANWDPFEFPQEKKIQKVRL